MLRKAIKWLLVAISLFCIVGVILINSGYDPAVSWENPKFRASIYFMEPREHQPAIEKYFIEHKTLEGAISAVDLSKMHYEADAIFLTSPNGAIAAIDKNISISILLWPEISNETLVWHCSVSPKNVSPVFCNGGANVLPNKAD